MSFLETLQTQSKEDATKVLFDMLSAKAIDALSSMQEEQIDEGVRGIGNYSKGRHQATTYKDSDTGEYRVKFMSDGKHLKDADYFTSDKEDAAGTAKHQVEQLHAKD